MRTQVAVRSDPGEAKIFQIGASRMEPVGLSSSLFTPTMSPLKIGGPHLRTSEGRIKWRFNQSEAQDEKKSSILRLKLLYIGMSSRL